MDELSNNTAIITGGATGIGFALAKALGGRGASVIIAEPRVAELERATGELRELGIDASFQQCDITQPDQVEALADEAWGRSGRIDMVINNAGIGFGPSSVVDTDIDALRRTFEVNFFGVYLGCKIFGKRLIEQDSPSSMWNTGSENSFFVAIPNGAGYVASKHAVHGLTTALREEMPDHVHVGLIIPGFVSSGLTAGVAHLAMDADRYAEIVVPQLLERRFYVVSHAHNAVRVEARHAEIAEAYERYAPRYEGDEQYDVRTLMQAAGMLPSEGEV